MKKEGKSSKKKEGLVNNNGTSKKVMSSNLPLLFANGRPRSLETISQAELEEFVPFMILCSLGEELHKKPKLINNCPVPEWWPQGFPFKFPLIELSDWTDRQVMLKSLVCRCYTFYDCEFLLKFSSELAEMSPAHLKYEDNKLEKTTSIYDASGCMLVKCRNENLYYDMHKNRRRYLSPTHRPTLSQTKKFEPVIDLTFDTSSEDEKEVYFKEVPVTSLRAEKRKAIAEQSEEPSAKQRCRRLFDDFPVESPEPEHLNQEQHLAKLRLIPSGRKIVEEYPRNQRKKRLAHCFTVINITSERGQKLLERNKHCFNLEACLERINRFCGTEDILNPENNQVCTRSSVLFSALYKDDVNNNPAEEKQVDDQFKWCHVYKWPHRTRNPCYPHKGPSLKPCSVALTILSEETISRWMKKRTVGTMTPEGWWGSKLLICNCLKTAHTELDSDTSSKYKDKSSSTKCSCVRSKQQISLSSQSKKLILEVKHSTGSREQNNLSLVSSMKVRHRTVSDGHSHIGGGFKVSGSSLIRSVNHSFSHDKEGLSVISYNAIHENGSSFKFKRTFHRKPLAVVPPSPIVLSKDVQCQSIKCLPHPTMTSSATKINFHRSILDAIKWYTKDDANFDSLVKEEILWLGIDPSQENIKPLTIPNSDKPIIYFQQNQNINNMERDYCYERSSDGTTKLVTRRGERHYINREPCPSCFQGRDNFCVYEFIRQAKLAGMTLHKNQKLLQLIFFKIIQAVNGKS